MKEKCECGGSIYAKIENIAILLFVLVLFAIIIVPLYFVGTVIATIANFAIKALIEHISKSKNSPIKPILDSIDNAYSGCFECKECNKKFNLFDVLW